MNEPTPASQAGKAHTDKGAPKTETAHAETAHTDGPQAAKSADRTPVAESSSGDVHNLMAQKEIYLRNGDTDAAQKIDVELRKLGVEP